MTDTSDQLRERFEPDPRKWCGNLLAYASTPDGFREVECNLTQGHGGRCRHLEVKSG